MTRPALTHLAAIQDRLEARTWGRRDFEGAAVQRRARAVADATFLDVSEALQSADPIETYLSYRRAMMLLMTTLASRASRVIPPSRAACKSGCAYCCHAAVQVAPAEAIWIASRIGKRAQGPLLLARAGSTGEQRRSLGPEFDLDCAFLASNGQCRIYDVRPLACALHSSFDVDSCAKGQWKCLPSPRIEVSASLAMMSACYHRAAKLTCTVELCAAVALATPDAARRWIAGEGVFAEASVAPDQDQKVMLAVAPSIERILAGGAEVLR
jgi:Fe-S-cluster containining protein